MQKIKKQKAVSKHADKSSDRENSTSLDQPADSSLFPVTTGEQKALDEILRMLLKSNYIDFSHYRQPTVLRRIARRITLNNKAGFAEYRDFLTGNPGEADLLCDDLLLSHTEFFRDPPVFEALREGVFQKFLVNRPAKMPIRVWVAGCSTGEEVYSLAISLHEVLAESKSGITAQFFGTDLNLRHINRARKGLYPDKIRKSISRERLARYFDQTPEGLQVTKQIREMCVFAVQDVAQDPPFPSIDLVSCRNVLIYFDAALQDIVLPLFHFALKPGGLLLLGSSESMGKHADLFTPVNQKINLYAKRVTRNKPLYRFPVSQLPSRLRAGYGPPQVPAPVVPYQAPGCLDIGKEVDEALLHSFAPPCMVVDSTMQIRLFRGDTSAFLTPSPGEASLKLSKMASEGLMPDLYVAIEEAKKKNRNVFRKNVSYRQGKSAGTVDISIFPIPDPSACETCFLITFQKTAGPGLIDKQQSSGTAAIGGELARLRNELQSTKEHLQSIVEEKDEVNQELWAANEEIQSTNEELQSVNEEMEAAKEELEASNEELVAQSEELRFKNIELKESEIKFRRLVWDMQVGVILQNPGAEITLCNPKALELLGITENQLIGKTSFDPDWNVIHEDGSPFPGPDHPVPRAIASGKPVRNVIMGVYRPAKGDRVWLLVDAEPQLGDDKSVHQVTCTFIDITNRKQAEEALRKSEMVYRSIFASSPMGIHSYELLPGGRLVFIGANPAADVILGVDNSIFIGKTIEEAFPPLAATEVPARYREVITSGRQWQTEQIDYRHDKISGAFYVVAFRITPNRMVAMFLDITERKQAEVDLVRLAKEWQTTFDANIDAIWLLDKDHRIIRSNKASCRIFNCGTTDIVGKYCWEIAHGTTAPVADCPALRSKKTLARESLKYQYKNRWFETVVDPLLDPQGGYAGAVHIVSDITAHVLAEKERRKYEQHLQQTQKLESLGVLAGGIAHDFNNLMGGIFGYVDLAKNEPDRDLASSYLAKAITTMDRARGLTRQLLTFARGGAPVRRVQPLFPFINEAATFALSGSNVSCRFAVEEDLWPCNIDKTQICQVIDNIIINAQQAMPDGGTICITAGNISLAEKEHLTLASGDYVKISIADTGIGIPKEILPKIFDPFYTTKSTGHGLGLATCYSIVTRHGGCIDVQSEQGDGSVFHLYLPAATGAIEEPPQTAIVHKGSGTIIVMDDETIISAMVGAMLRTFGYSVVCKKDGRETLDFLLEETKTEHSVVAMILDLTIPGGMGGKATVAEIRKTQIDLPVFVASGYADDPVMKDPARYGFTASIGKPFTKDELAQMLERHVPKKRA